MKKRKLFLILVLITVFTFLGINTKAETISIDSWDKLESALLNAQYDQINVTNDLEATKNLSINRNVSINFNNKKVDLKTRSFNIAASSTLIIKDVEFTGTRSFTSGTGALLLEGSIKSISGNTASIAAMSGGTVTMDNAEVYFDSGNSSSLGIAAKNFTITNKSHVVSDAEKFYGTSSSADTGAVIKINGQSVVQTNSLKGTTSNTHGQAWDIGHQADVYIQGKGTKLTVDGNGRQQSTNGGIFLLVAPDSTINVEDEAEFYIHSYYASALLLQSSGGSINVRNYSKLDITQEDSQYDLGAAIRFRSAGNMTFNVENSSTFNVNKKAGDAPAIRMFGGNNAINITGGSDFIVYNAGTVNAIDPGTSGGNQGILYTAGNNNSFSLIGKDSNVSITAKNGAAIDSKNNSVSIKSTADTYFVTRGKTATKTASSFNAGVLSMELDAPTYYDFSNSTGQLFESLAKDRIDREDRFTLFESKKSDMSAWKIGSNLGGNPYKSWTLIDYGLAGADLVDFVHSNQPNFEMDFGKMNSYSRITGNNQAAKVKSIRTPTNSDKYIYVDVDIPEGKYDDDRPAFDNEVGVKVGMYDENDNEITTISGRTGTYAVYGEEEKMGIAKIAIPNNKFIKTGTKFKILSAWRGAGEENSSDVHMSTIDDIEAEDVIAIDVTPPNQVKSDINLTNSSKQIEGTGDEDGSKVFLKVNGEWLLDSNSKPVSTVVSSGKWTVNLPSYLEKEDIIDVYIKDTTEITTNIPYDLPTTYTQEPDDIWGNISVDPNGYSEYVGYHDAVKIGSEDLRFDPALRLNTADVLPDKPKLTKTFDAPDKDNIQVGDTLTYKINVKNDKESSYDTNWKKVVVTDPIPDGLLFDKSTADLKLNNVLLAEEDYDYDETTRMLKVSVGNLKSQESAEISFKTKLTASSVGKKITNIATATGNSPREKEFVIGPENEGSEKKTYSVDGKVSTDNEVFGTIEITSFPTTIDFGTIVYDAKIQRIDNGAYDKDLIINDTRAKKESWTLGAKLIKQMSKVGEESIQLVDSLQYFDGKDDIILSTEIKPIYQSNNEDKTKDVINISDNWGTVKRSEGIKLIVDPSKSNISKGTYEGIIEWQLMEATP